MDLLISNHIEHGYHGNSASQKRLAAAAAAARIQFHLTGDGLKVNASTLYFDPLLLDHFYWVLCS